MTSARAESIDRSAILAVALLAVALLAGGCGKSNFVAPPPLPPVAVRVTSGDAQTSIVGSVLAPVVIRVEDARGRGVRRVPVVFRILRGGGNIDSASVATDSVGAARVRWRLGVVADSQRLEVAAPGASGARLFAVVRAVAVAGPLAALARVTPAAVSGTGGLPLSDSLGVRATDAYGNGIGGAVVVWSVPDGSGVIAPRVTTTRADGVARAAWTLGPAVAGAVQYANAVLQALSPIGAPPVSVYFEGKASP